MGDRSARAKWVRLITAWKRSGLTARAFARRHGIKPATLSWWQWRLRADESPRDDRHGLRLVAVTAAGDDAGSCAWELSTASGDVLRVHDRIERAALVEVLAVIARRRSR